MSQSMNEKGKYLGRCNARRAILSAQGDPVEAEPLQSEDFVRARLIVVYLSCRQFGLVMYNDAVTLVSRAHVSNSQSHQNYHPSICRGCGRGLCLLLLTPIREAFVVFIDPFRWCNRPVDCQLIDGVRSTAPIEFSQNVNDCSQSWASSCQVCPFVVGFEQLEAILFLQLLYVSSRIHAGGTLVWSYILPLVASEVIIISQGPIWLSPAARLYEIRLWL